MARRASPRDPSSAVVTPVPFPSIERLPVSHTTRAFAWFAGALLLTAAAFSAAQSPAASETAATRAAAGPADPRRRASPRHRPRSASRWCCRSRRRLRARRRRRARGLPRSRGSRRRPSVLHRHRPRRGRRAGRVRRGAQGRRARHRRPAGARRLEGRRRSWRSTCHGRSRSTSSTTRHRCRRADIHVRARRRERRARHRRAACTNPACRTSWSSAVRRRCMKRFAGAFAGEWIWTAARCPTRCASTPSPDALTALRRDLGESNPGRRAPRAWTATSATLAKPYIGARDRVRERPRVRAADGRRHCATSKDVALVEIPWIVTPDAPEFARFPRREFGSAALERLYALGLDAFRVAQAFLDGVRPSASSWTARPAGSRSVEGRQFAREGRLAVYRGGRSSSRSSGR